MRVSNEDCTGYYYRRLWRRRYCYRRGGGSRCHDRGGRLSPQPDQKKMGSVLTFDTTGQDLARVTNHLSSLNATVARGGRWIKIECSRPIHCRSSLRTPP